MKLSLLPTATLSFALVIVNNWSAFGQGGTVRTQANWATPVLKDANRNVVAPGTPLTPSTVYYISLQALPPIASDNNGNPVLNVLYIQVADGLDPSTIPNGIDVPVPGGRGYQGDVYVKTDVASNLPAQIYIRYRGETGEPIPNYPFTQYTLTNPSKQAFLP